jgi:pilus assembly protein CpaE
MASDELTPIATGPRLLACLADPASAQAVRDFAAAQRWRNAAIVEGGVVAAHEQLQNQTPPNLLVVDVDDAEDPVQALYALAELCPPEMSVIAIGQRNDLNLYRDLMELGVTDYLPKPIDVQMLERALKRNKRVHGGDEPSKAQVITLMGARGGVGTTTVAAGLAWCLSHLHNRSVAVVDLDLHFGNLALSLDLVPGPGLREALEYPARMDARLLGSAMLHESPQLSVLAAEEPLVDLPQVAAGAAGVVTDLSLAAARDTLRLVEFNRVLSPTAKHMVIGNQVGAPHRGEVGRTEFERVVGLTLDGAIPFEAQAALPTSSMGTALPAALRNSKAAAEFAALAEQICGVQAPKKRSGLSKKLLPGLPGWLKRSA